jgi:uncharacterized protein YggE
MRASALLCGLAVVCPAVAQTPGRLQVEVTEELRAKPDACQLDLKVEVRNPDPTDAATEVADEFNKVKAAFAALKIEGATLTPLPLMVTRQEIQGRRGLPAEVEYRVTRPLKVLVDGKDFDTLSETVTKLQNELYAAGVKNSTDGGVFKPRYYKKDVWQEPQAAVLERAAKRARVKAERLATAAGERLGALVSTQEVNYVTPANPTAPVFDHYTFDEGEMVFRFRVRVVYEVTK